VKIEIHTDGEREVLRDDDIAGDFGDANLSDGNHSRARRRKIFDAVMRVAEDALLAMERFAIEADLCLLCEQHPSSAHAERCQLAKAPARKHPSGCDCVACEHFRGEHGS